MVERQRETMQSKALEVSYDSSICRVLCSDELRRAVSYEAENLQTRVAKYCIFGHVFYFELVEPCCAVLPTCLVESKRCAGSIVDGYVTTPTFLTSPNELLLSSGAGLRSPPRLSANYEL